MATQRIINGPSRWDIMLSFFEEKSITFTLEDRTVITMSGILCMWNMKGYDPLVDDLVEGDKDYWNGGIAEGYLLRGFYNTPMQDHEIFLEYRLRSRQGHCIIVGPEVLNRDPAFLPSHWSRIMGLTKGNYDN